MGAGDPKVHTFMNGVTLVIGGNLMIMIVFCCGEIFAGNNPLQSLAVAYAAITLFQLAYVLPGVVMCFFPKLRDMAFGMLAAACASCIVFFGLCLGATNVKTIVKLPSAQKPSLTNSNRR